MLGDVLSVIELVGKVLLPVATEMIATAVAGGDPLSVLARERVEAIVPATLRSELALAAAKAARAHAAK
jgi:hypothetical protein